MTCRRSQGPQTVLAGLAVAARLDGPRAGSTVGRKSRPGRTNDAALRGGGSALPGTPIPHKTGQVSGQFCKD